MLNLILIAVAMAESSGGVNIEGAADELGPLHIRCIYVDDVNRIIGCDTFTYDDRLDLGKSRQMFTVYVTYYATEKRLGRKPTWEDYCRIHAGGPNGWKKKCTEQYWRDVLAAMASEKHKV